MENKVVVLCADGTRKEYILPKFGDLTIQTQDGKITLINRNIKEKI